MGENRGNQRMVSGFLLLTELFGQVPPGTATVRAVGKATGGIDDGAVRSIHQ